MPTLQRGFGLFSFAGISVPQSWIAMNPRFSFKYSGQDLVRIIQPDHEKSYNLSFDCLYL